MPDPPVLVPPAYAALLASDRVSARVRAVCARRAVADDPACVPRALSRSALEVLRVIASFVVPDSGLDLAARVDARLASGEGDGWRRDILPADVVAYEDALADLAGVSISEAVLASLAAGSHPAGRLSGEQLAAWFEDACVDLVTQWVAHPATLARIGYDGFATGGGDVPFRGFTALGLGEREPWEPV